jgi:hypothetical protein
MNGAAKDFVAVIEACLPSVEEHDNSERFLREVRLLSKILGEIISAMEDGKTRKTNITEQPNALVIVSIDEAHILSERLLPPNAYRTSFNVFAHVLSHITAHPIAFTAMSTNSRMSALATPPDMHPSFRVVGKAEKLLIPVPFTELSFDIFAFAGNEPITHDGLTLEDVSETGFFVRFGRPL